MKKLSLKNLKLTSQDQLQRDQLKTVFGGNGGYGGYGTWTCYCGHVGGGYEHTTVQITATSTSDALNQMNCGGLGATCNGN